MEIENILKEYSEDKGKIRHHRFKEIEPFVWLETGETRPWIQDSKSVVVNGEVYTKDFTRHNCVVPYWAFPFKLGNTKYAIDLDTGEKIKYESWLTKETISCAPHFKANVFYYHGWGLQQAPKLSNFEPIEKREGRKHFGFMSENPTANIIQNLCIAYDIDTSPYDYYENEYSYRCIVEWRHKKKPLLKFRHLLLEYGWNNKIYCDYTFEQLINMDPAIFLKDDLEFFEYECRRNEILKNTLNFNIFKRQLTDTEKVDCAAKLFNFIVKHQKLSISCNPSIQNPY